MIYREFKTWKEAVKYRFKMLFSALYGVLYLCLIMGIVSVFCYVMRQINAFFRRETKAACIITLIIVVLAAGWIGTFVKERYQRVQAQHVADSLAYDLSKFTQMYDTAEIIVVNGDTLTFR